MRSLLLLILFLVAFWFFRRLWKALTASLSPKRPEVHRRRGRRGEDEIDGGRIIDVPFTEHHDTTGDDGQEEKKDGR
jgi:hypothetical protein